MKRPNVLKAGMLAGLLIFTAVHAFAADPDTLYVRYIEGGVELAEAGSSQWMGAVVNTPLIEGDTIRTTPTGRAELFLKDGSVVRIGKGSTMKIIAVEQNGVQFRLDRGMTYIGARGSKEVPIFFDTPSAALDITMPATLRVDAYDGGVSEISVYSGTVYAVQQKGKMPVKAGERIVLRDDGSAPVLAGLRGADEWQRWNEGRDRASLADYGTSESYAYLPEELRSYSSDLDANGQWVYTDEYSYVWVPTVITVSSWSPYRVGRWAWIRGSYVWIGYEPWGWAPYHYGRWAYHGRAGWCWVPPERGHVRWEPAHVAWVHSSKHVGWVPLAPGEAYDRSRAPVIHQTNIYNTYNNVTIDRSVGTARSVYKNAIAANSVVTMERDRLLRQKAVNVNVVKTGAVGLKKVNLPSNVLPARAKNMQPLVADRSKAMPGEIAVTGQKAPVHTKSGGIGAASGTGALAGATGKRPVLQRPGVSGTPGVSVPGSAAAAKSVPATVQRTPVTPGSRTAIKGKEQPPVGTGTVTQKTAVSLKDRIGNARKGDVKAMQQDQKVRTVPNTTFERRIDEGKSIAGQTVKQRTNSSETSPVSASPVPARNIQGQNLQRPLQERIAGSQPSVRQNIPQQVKQKPAAAMPDRTRQPNAAGNNTVPGSAAIRPPVVTTKQFQNNAPKGNAVSNAPPARTATVSGGAPAAAQKPIVNTRPPAQNVKVQEQPRQAPQRREVKPAVVRSETAVQTKAAPARQAAPKEKANAGVSTPAPPAPQVTAATGGKSGSGGNPKSPEANKGGRPQLQQNAERR